MRTGKPRFTEDNPKAKPCPKKAKQRAKYILGFTNRKAVHPDCFFQEVDKFGLGDKRPIEEYFRLAGIDPKRKRVELNRVPTPAS